MTRTYWLDPSREPDEIAAEARSRINRYAERMQTSGRAEVMRRMSRLAFSRDADSGLDARAVQIGGEQGELIGTRDNQLGTLNRQVGNMVTSARPSYTARSIATSAESIMHVNVATALCDFMISRRGAEEAAKRAQIHADVEARMAIARGVEDSAFLGMGLSDEERAERFHTYGMTR